MLGNLKFSVFLVALLFSAHVLGQDGKTTTTTAATTTTTSTTTTPPPTTTATTKPPTTTTVAPPTTAAPTPAPKKFPANEGKWSVVDDKNVTCILFKGALELVVSYQDKNNQNRTASVDIPIAAEPTGTCGNVQTLTLTWPAGQTPANTLTFTFESNGTEVLQEGSGITSGKYALQNITGVILKDSRIFVNASNPDTPFTFEYLNKAAFQTPFNHSYSCLAQESLKSDNDQIILKISDIRMEAFKKSAPGHQEFSASIDCPADDASDLVPIAVGAALASLVVIVLIAYLIGRRRSRARGYQSV